MGAIFCIAFRNNPLRYNRKEISYMPRFDLAWLAVFDGIFKTRSVSRTAERLGSGHGEHCTQQTAGTF